VTKVIKDTGKDIAAFSGVTLSAINIIITLTKDRIRLQNTALLFNFQ